MQSNNEHNELLKLGLKNNKIILIHEVENGLKCGCICPSCGQLLIAKNNPQNVKVAHFAHYNELECSAALETALHKLAKEILISEKSLFIPSYTCSGFGGTKTYITERLIHFGSVEVEKRVLTNGTHVIADALGLFEDRLLIIEFAKTHFVDEVKKNKIKESGYACVEIDLNGIEQSRKAVRDVLLQGLNRVVWINNPKGERLFKLDQEEHKRKQEKEKLELEQQKAKERLEQERRIMDYKNKNFHVIEQQADGTFFCPGRNLIEKGFTQTHYGRHPVIQKILQGNQWNGKIYGFILSPQYIYVGPEKIELQANGTDDRKRNYLYASLKKFSALRKLLSNRPCRHCNFFTEKIGNTTICSFKVDQDARDLDFYRYADLIDED